MDFADQSGSFSSHPNVDVACLGDANKQRWGDYDVQMQAMPWCLQNGQQPSFAAAELTQMTNNTSTDRTSPPRCPFLNSKVDQASIIVSNALFTRNQQAMRCPCPSSMPCQTSLAECKSGCRLQVSESCWIYLERGSCHRP
jgi:hypothetical protein